MRVGIVGAGTAGAAVAILLARQGAEVSVFERVHEPKPVGAGIMLQPTGQAVLARMGLLQPIAERGARIDRLWFRTPSGRTIVDLQYAAIDRDWHAYGIHRGLLFDTLYTAACREVTVSTGCEMRGLRRDGAATYLVCKDGSERGPFDLIVIADGAVSELRTSAGTTKRDAQYPWGALWFVADDPDGVYTRELYQIGVRSHTAKRRSSACSGACRCARSRPGETRHSIRGKPRSARSIRGSISCSTRSPITHK